MASLFIYNARLRSFHPGFQTGEADTLIVRGDRIGAIGKREDLLPLADPQTQMIDAEGRTLMPGFHDTHIHLWKVGSLKTYMLDLRSSSSLDEMLSLLRDYDKQYPDNAWITARGFNEARWKTGTLPTREDLDKVSRDKPVYVIRTCAHIAIANTKALEISGIRSDTKPPEGGVIGHDSTGRPNGVFSETALGLITAHIPAYSKDALKTMIRAAREECWRYGITSVTDPAVDPVLLEAYYEMQQAGELGIRLQAMPILLPDGGLRPYPFPKPYSSSHLAVNTVKFFSDGGLSGQTAALKRPYKNSRQQGVLRLEKDLYLSLCRSAHEQGLGVATHAIGDAAIEFVTDIYTRLFHSFPSSIRRIEHLGLPEEKHLQTMAAHNISTSMQTIFLRELGRNFIKYLDEEYLLRCYPVKSVLRHGILAALSSDAPVVSDFNPLRGMEAAVTRQDRDGQTIAPGESISIEEALTAYTYSAARISHTPDRGSLEPGMLADFILLDRDPLSMPPSRLHEGTVQQTYVGGECVHFPTFC